MKPIALQLWLATAIAFTTVSLNAHYAISQETATKSKAVAVAGTGVMIQPPEGFEKATTFNGFQQESTGSSIMVTVLPGPYATVTKGFTKKALASQGMKLRSKKDVEIAGGEGQLLSVIQDANGQKFRKWMTVFGTESKTTMVTGTFLASNSELSKSIRDSVLSVTPASTKSGSSTKTSRSKGLFQLDEVEGLLPVAQLNASGKISVHNDTGRIPMEKATSPIFVVAPSTKSVQIDNRQEYALQRLNKTAGTTIDETSTTSEVTINGISGIEIEASGHLTRSNEKLVVYQVMLFPSEGTYVLMSGRVGKEESETYLPKFKTMAKSFKMSTSESK